MSNREHAQRAVGAALSQRAMVSALDQLDALEAFRARALAPPEADGLSPGEVITRLQLRISCARIDVNKTSPPSEPIAFAGGELLTHGSSGEGLAAAVKLLQEEVRDQQPCFTMDYVPALSELLRLAHQGAAA